jgi:hypothetical protein
MGLGTVTDPNARQTRDKNSSRNKEMQRLNSKDRFKKHVGKG